jgi:hypothetical protein
MPAPVLSKNDIPDQARASRAPVRELSFYGGLRKGLEEAMEGMEKAELVVEQLAGNEPDNVRLQRYLAKMQAVYEGVHKLITKASRIKVNTGGGEGI